MDVVARHYLDALAAVPDDPDVDDIREQGVAALRRAGARADRTGAPARAVASYISAAELCDSSTSPGATSTAAALRESAALAAIASGTPGAAIEYATRAQQAYADIGETRAAARAQSLVGRGLQRSGRLREAREELVAAVGVLSENPDLDSLQALLWLVGVDTFSGSPEGEARANEALVLAQSLGPPPSVLARAFVSRGIWLSVAGRRAEAAMHLREADRLGEQAGDNGPRAPALLNLSDILLVDDPVAALAAARQAVELNRQAGDRPLLSAACWNLVLAHLTLGEWDAAVETLSDLAPDGLDTIIDAVISSAWITAIRGDGELAVRMLDALAEVDLTEDHQTRAQRDVAYGFAAVANRDPAEALRHGMDALSVIDKVGPASETIRWGWPLAARAAYELGDSAAVRALLARVSGYRSGELAPMMLAERSLVAARLAAVGEDPDADAMFTDAIAALRATSTPYHLAHGLLDHAALLAMNGDGPSATLAVAEAREIAERLRCRPLSDRVGEVAVAERSSV